MIQAADVGVDDFAFPEPTECDVGEVAFLHPGSLALLSFETAIVPTVQSSTTSSLLVAPSGAFVEFNFPSSSRVHVGPVAVPETFPTGVHFSPFAVERLASTSTKSETVGVESFTKTAFVDSG